MIKFKLSSKGVEHNLMDLFPNHGMSPDEICDFVTYHSKLSRWWKYKYNSEQPVEIIRLSF